MTTHLSRRTLLASVGLVAGLGLGACGRTDEARVAPFSDAFAIAHRGGGRNWPEMTLYAYQQAARIESVQAMEVSVHRTLDGVLVCHHDFDTARVGSRKHVIARTTWRELKDVMVLPRETLDPSQPPRPLARFDEVLEAWPAGVTMWAEPKPDDAVEPLFARLDKLPDLDVVWKRPINAPGFDRAKMQGWGTFGYVLDGPQQTRYLEQVAPSRWLDMVGVQESASDERVREVVTKAGSYGKRTVMWALANLEQRDRALRLGCRGLMCSNIAELVDAPLPQA